MVKRLRWSERALQDKKNIFDYWNETNGNKAYSKQLNNRFNEVTELLYLFPECGRKVDNYDARFIVKGDYIFFYKLQVDLNELNIDILHIWDSRRDPSSNV